MSVMHQSTTIANGASASGVIDLTDLVLIAIEMPSAWTAATIAFEASQTVDGTFVPVYDAAGTELEVTTAASRVVLLPPEATRAFRFVKLRSGPSSARVTQGAARALNIATAVDLAIA